MSLTVVGAKVMLAKYNKQGPRYTSYPPVPFWKNAPDEMTWISHLKKNYNEREGMDLYVHIPFCQKLCYYCGCNRIVTKNLQVQDDFIQTLIMEWQLYCEKIGLIPKVNSLHFGGGTPTFLTPENLERLIQALTTNKKENFIGSIEIDPRNTTIEHLDCFKKNGIERISLGIQDFDSHVQVAINRHQPFSLVESLMMEMRKREFESINFDVIYGLPKQNAETIRETFRLIKKLRPDMIAFYSYAHLPERMKNQRLINDRDLPQAEKKQALYDLGKELLLADGYLDIGMDHFALPENFLYRAHAKELLHRNFMGYVDKKSPILLGLGPSSISDSSQSFIQNEKGLGEYEMKIKSGSLALAQGHTHDERDLNVQKIILNLMCRNETQLGDVSLIPHWQEISEDLMMMEEDGLLKIDRNSIKVLPVGKKFIRSIAMVFDFYFREKMPTERFSRTI
jgi:oxygen-independent coproporphyrinogen-3 oxidase